MDTKGIVVVTGVCGILGGQVARHLIDLGHVVAGIDLSESEPSDVDLAHFAGGIDLTDPAATERAFASLRLEVGPLTGLANIAGGFAWETIQDGSPETWEKMWAMNVRTCLNACRSALTHFSENGGSIVNVSAKATQNADLGMAAYTAAKSGVSRLTESLAEELKSSKIRVNAVMPTIIDTPQNRSDMPDADFSSWVSPQELSNVMSFLLSNEASAITGALLPVAGRI